MAIYISRRLLASIPVVILVSAVLFFVMRLLPGDVSQIILTGGGTAATVITEEQRQQVRKDIGLDRPLPVQYVDWVAHAARGDLGTSFHSKKPVSKEVARRIPVNIELAALAILLSLMISVPAGVIAAVDQDGPIDYPMRLFAILGLAVPSFFLAIIGITLAAIWFGVTPPVRYASPTRDMGINLRIMFWPGLTLAVGLAATVTRMIRAGLLETLRQDYVRTARAKGLPGRRVVMQHALRNTLIPVVTLIGAQVSSVLSGSVVMEQVFLLPGLGRLAIDSINGRDYFMLQGVVLLFALIVIATNLLVDLAYALIDPRIRYK
jgi:peptide/nickel transport system permease protein